MENELKPCPFCGSQAHIVTYLGKKRIGNCENGFRMMLCSGWGKPLRIEVEKWDDKAGWHKIGQYYPTHCPNCGREITEYKK